MAESLYELSIEVNDGDVYKSKGKTLDEALEKLSLDYMLVKTKGTITLTHGSKRAQRFLYLPQMRAIVANKYRKQMVARNLASLLK